MQRCTMFLMAALLIALLVGYVMCKMRLVKPKALSLPPLPLLAMQKWDTIQNMMRWRSEMSSLDGIMHELSPAPPQRSTTSKEPEWWPPPAEEEETPLRHRGSGGP